MHHQNGQIAQQLQGVVPVADAVHGVAAGAVKAQGRRRLKAVDGVGGPRQGPGAQGALVQPLAAVLQPGYVPGELGGIGQQVLGEGHGLGPLQVGIARHDGALVPARLGAQDLLQVQQLPNNGPDLLPHVQPEIQGYLVVPGAGGVEALPRFANALGQQGLDIHVDILVGRGELHLSRLDIRQDFRQALPDRVLIRLGDDPLGRQHLRMGKASLDILPVEPLVKVNGGLEIVGQGIRLLAEPSAPKFHGMSAFPKMKSCLRRHVRRKHSLTCAPCTRKGHATSVKQHSC